jgi:hypothetical protein
LPAHIRGGTVSKRAVASESRGATVVVMNEL